MTEAVFVALGSNLGDREQHIYSALEELSKLESVRELVASSLYQTTPMGPQDQPDYLNCVCRFNYGASVRELLAELQSIERAHGRVKATARWTARPLDLDILLFGCQQINDADLQIPHIGIADRSFVLWPLAELQADLHVPGLANVQSLMMNCQKFGIERYSFQKNENK